MIVPRDSGGTCERRGSSHAEGERERERVIVKGVKNIEWIIDIILLLSTRTSKFDDGTYNSYAVLFRDSPILRYWLNKQATSICFVPRKIEIALTCFMKINTGNKK